MNKTILCISVHREDDSPVFGESATHVILEDEAAGYFIKLKQYTDNPEPETIKLDFDEIDDIIEAIDTLKEQI